MSGGKRLQRLVKRGVDVVGASVGICVLSPVFVTVGVAVARTMGRPVFFGHRRPGYKDQPFTMYKFRSMRAPRPGEDPYYSDKDRLTRLGVFLKKYSLDELPELYNVLKGEMSLVGPRPLLMSYLDKYTPEQRRRHDVKPGITGWAQVKGRTAQTLSQKFEHDVWYVDHWSLWLDAKILLMTIRGVLFPDRSVVEQDHAAIDDVQFLNAKNQNRL